MVPRIMTDGYRNEAWESPGKLPARAVAQIEYGQWLHVEKDQFPFNATSLMQSAHYGDCRIPD